MNKVSRKVVIGLSLKHENTKVGNGYFPREGLIFQSDYFLMLRPVLWMGFVFGRIPCYVRSGWMRYSYKSLPFAYAVILALANWICHLYYRKKMTDAFNQMLGSSVSFSNVLFSFLIFTQPLTTIVMVYSWVFEVPAIVESYNTTAILEKKLSNIFLTSSRKLRTRRIVTVCITAFFVFVLVVAYFLIVGRYGDEYPLLILLLIIMNYIVNYSHSVLWCFSFYFIRDFAVKLNKHMLLCLQMNENCAFKLKTCRKIWLSIWRLSQNNSHSIAVTIGYTLFTNGTIFVIGCYGVIASIRDLNVLGILEMSPYVGVTLVTIAGIFEMPYQATNKLGNGFLNTMVTLNSDAIDQRCREEMHKFMTTINQTRNAAITLKDYMPMDRTILISFLSYSVTYLIVLLQFQDKNTDNSTSSTQNNTNLE